MDVSSVIFGVVGLAAAGSASPAYPVADEVLYRREPLAVAAVSVPPGDTLAHAVYGARAASVVSLLASDGQGSGSLIRDDGWILTCAHVVGKDPLVDVVTQGGGSYRGRVMATDNVADLALVKIESVETLGALPWIPIGDVDGIEVGDPVVAIGHPKGFGWTLNEGIVSNLFVFRDGRHDPNVIQTQVPLNPGNSGGPLLDREGRLVGVVSQGDPNAQALNWCISARAVKLFLLRHGDLMPPADLAIFASPAGATIFIDGNEIGKAPRATARIGLGAHVVKVQKAGLGEISAPVVVMQRTNAEIRLRLSPTGTLAIAADAPEVDVYVDGVYRGVAPLSMEIAEGAHAISGVKSGSRQSHASATVKAEQQVEISLSHPSTRAFLSVVSSPIGAEVIIDGESAGVTPVAERTVDPGRHVVDVKRNDYSRRVVVDLTADARRQLEFNMEPAAATATSAPTSATPSNISPSLAPRALRAGSSARLHSGLGISLGGVALSVASAAVLLTQKDDMSRTAAAATMVAGATGMIIGPAIFFRELGPRDPRAVIRADRERPEREAAPGVRAAFRF